MNLVTSSVGTLVLLVVIGATHATSAAAAVHRERSPSATASSPAHIGALPQSNAVRDTVADQRLVRDAVSRFVPWLPDSTAIKGTLFVVANSEGRATHAVFGTLEDFERIKAKIEDFELRTTGMRIVQFPAGTILSRSLSVAIVAMK